MRISVDWADEQKNIIVQSYPAQWSWDEFRQLQVIMPRMMRDVSHTVHVVGDFSQHQYLPYGNPVMHARNLMASYPTNFGLLFILTRTGLIESFVKAFMKIFAGSFGSRIRIVASWEEINEIIQAYELTP